MNNVAKYDRNKEIVRLVDEERMTKTAVAKRFGITKQRVQQIYQRETDVQDIWTARDGENDNPS